jgi:hypothetical protein
VRGREASSLAFHVRKTPHPYPITERLKCTVVVRSEHVTKHLRVGGIQLLVWSHTWIKAKAHEFAVQVEHLTTETQIAFPDVTIRESVAKPQTPPFHWKWQKHLISMLGLGPEHSNYLCHKRTIRLDPVWVYRFASETLDDARQDRQHGNKDRPIHLRFQTGDYPHAVNMADSR